MKVFLSSCSLLLACLLIYSTSAQSRLWARQVTMRVWVNEISDLSYGSDPQNRLDLMRPRWSTRGVRPAVVVFHGGAWRDGGRAEMRDRVCRRYLAHGFSVANVEYRRGLIPASEDALGSLEWIFRNASSYGIDPARIVVTGESAGAHLALYAAFHSRLPVAAVVNFYGISDLTSMLGEPLVSAVLPPGGEGRDQARRLSPLAQVHPGMAPVFSIHGTADSVVPLDQTHRLTEKIRSMGGDAAELALEGAGHGLSDLELETAYRAVFAFLDQRGIS